MQREKNNSRGAMITYYKFYYRTNVTKTEYPETCHNRDLPINGLQQRRQK